MRSIQNMCKTNPQPQHAPVSRAVLSITPAHFVGQLLGLRTTPRNACKGKQRLRSLMGKSYFSVSNVVGGDQLGRIQFSREVQVEGDDLGRTCVFPLHKYLAVFRRYLRSKWARCPYQFPGECFLHHHDQTLASSRHDMLVHECNTIHRFPFDTKSIGILYTYVLRQERAMHEVGKTLCKMTTLQI